MSLVKVKTKYQVTLPTKIRKQAGIDIGDLLETKVERGKITLAPKVVIDRDEYTAGQRRVIDARLAESAEDVRKGRTYGPFNTAEEMITSMKEQLKKRTAAKKTRRSR